jgi:PTH1 family peptidyl-tRNA hydrolase
MGTRKHLGQSSVDGEQTGPLLVVGLGNPGSKYQDNRHNVGFMAIDRFASAFSIKLGRVQAKAIVGKGIVGNHSVILAKPQTFMNRSGNSVGQLVRFYKLPLACLLVVYDELDLPLGALRLRQKGGAGGHNGMKSIIQHLGSEFPRLRLGIGRPRGQMDPAAYVLQDFSTSELPVVDQMLDDALAAIESFIELGIDPAMTQHNKT